ncbi:hypothetical protein CEXT_419781 [Caerostris extrusa]|uniref:Uncharacterized protein n=1 Tax=Caerostris extrusa TaxID=172846 RepID=A0AAV4TBI5_CAEEX|nr:hypothetical protein CEXT_419781 [Caerostris extrusa]
MTSKFSLGTITGLGAVWGGGIAAAAASPCGIDEDLERNGGEWQSSFSWEGVSKKKIFFRELSGTTITGLGAVWGGRTTPAASPYGIDEDLERNGGEWQSSFSWE